MSTKKEHDALLRESFTLAADTHAKLLASHKAKLFKDVTVLGALGEHQIVEYDQDKLADLRVLLYMGALGSVFRRGRIWWQILAYISFALIVGCVCFFLIPKPAKINYTAMSNLSSYFNMFLPFLLGIYLNNVFTRWWTMRSQGVGALNNAVNNLCIIMTSYCGGPEMKEARHLMLRYGLLSHELVYRSARKTAEELEDLVESGALRAEECGLLQELPGSKPQSVWVWIQLLWDGLHRQGKIPAHVHQVILGFIADGRTAVKLILMHLNTQMPFAYVHLMACLVHANLFILSLQAGIVLAKCAGMLHLRSQGEVSLDMEAEVLILTQVVLLTMVPMLYLGFLELSQEICDPFGTDPNDFPRAYLHDGMQNECESFFKMAGPIPPALLCVLGTDGGETA